MNSMKRSRILIVDDDPGVIVLLSEYLSKEGFSVLSATDSRTALERMREAKIDLAIIDIAMPKSDGISTLREMKKLNPDLPAIMLAVERDAERIW